MCQGVQNAWLWYAEDNERGETYLLRTLENFKEPEVL